METKQENNIPFLVGKRVSVDLGRTAHKQDTNKPFREKGTVLYTHRMLMAKDWGGDPALIGSEKDNNYCIDFDNYGQISWFTKEQIELI